MTTPRVAETLRTFIAHARSKDMDHQTIRMLLLSSGWKERDISIAIGAEGLTMPVPVPSDAGGARDAFFHLLGFAGLYTIVISFLVLCYTFINFWFPDPALEPYATMEGVRLSIRWSLAALIVAAPIFFWMSRLLLGEMHSNPEKEHSGVRRWLTYLTLFVAAGALMGDLMTVIFRLLDGEITLRFFLKAATVFATTGATFGYYFSALRRPLSEQGNLHRSFAWSVATVLGITILYGLILAGSPGAERDRKIDDARLQDIRSIASSILDYSYEGQRWAQPLPAGLPHPVPQDLATFAKETPRYKIPLADSMGEPYGYEALSSSAFRVCATFSFPSEANQWTAPFWNHAAGHSCYEFDTSRPDIP